MYYKFPHTINNGLGETITFLSAENADNGIKLIAENFVRPGVGPVMHVHWLQDECFTVLKGRIGYQLKGQPEQIAGEGETILFKKGVAHRFWNAGDTELHCTGYVYPAYNVFFFLSAVFAAQKKSGKPQPELFDGAYLLTRYASEFELTEAPLFVRKIVFPITYFIGKLLGKYKHFEHAPVPVRK